jgi:hypothetical protein
MDTIGHRFVTRARAAALALLGAAFVLAPPADAAGKKHQVPLTCSKGGDQVHSIDVAAPDRAAQGSKYTVRVDGYPSGKIEHAGLNYIHDMEVEYVVPAGTKYVEGSGKIVPNTGTPNVAATARVTHDKGIVHFVLPAKIEAGQSYTPPSFEFQLEITAAPGNELPLKMLRYSVVANAVVVGDTKAVCDPKPSPYPLVTTTVTKP